MMRWFSWLIALIGVLFLSSCGLGNQQDISEWMVQQRQSIPLTVQPLAEPRSFQPFVYQQKAVDPFSTQKIDVVSARTAVRPGGPDTSRRRDPLEFFPIDTLVMVGTLQRGGAKVALLRADKSVYQVQVGNYIGQNFGRISRITETSMDVMEKVQDAAGDWVERVSTLQLQENTK